MPVDVHDPANRDTHGGREADDSWRDAVRGVRDPSGLDVADVGCGAGVHSRAWADLGAAGVVGVDSSAVVLAAAEEGARGGARRGNRPLDPLDRCPAVVTGLHPLAGAAHGGGRRPLPAGELDDSAVAPGNAAGLRALLRAGSTPSAR